MRLNDPFKPRRDGLHQHMQRLNPKSEKEEQVKEVMGMAHRLYNHRPGTASPWWAHFNDGYPARKANNYGHYGMGFTVLESGEIELRDSCGGSPSSCGTRTLVHQATSKSVEVFTWSTRPVLYTEDGRKLTKRDYKPLHRCCHPHMIDRDASTSDPTMMVDHDLSIAAPLLVGEDGMYAYWPCEQSYPMTWSSWLVTIENETVCKVMAAALRKVCMYANAISAMVSAQNLTDAERAVIKKEAGRVLHEWKNASTMLGYLKETRDPTEIAQKIMDKYTSRQILALAQLFMPHQQVSMRFDRDFGSVHVEGAALNGIQERAQFSTTSQLWQMLREQTSEQYETKFLYAKPPAERSSWQLIDPTFRRNMAK